jgi:predicted phage-related endonuclease
MEPYVIDLLQEETGLHIVRRGQRYIDPKLPFLAAEIDAEAASGENIEIKTSSPFKAREWGEEQTDEIPIYYTAQAMHGLMVTGASVCVFGVLIGTDDFRVYRIERDDATIAGIRAKEQAFWQRIQAHNPPEPSTVADVLHWYGAGDAGKVIEASEAIANDVRLLKQLKEQIKQLGARASAAEERIKLYLADASILTVDRQPAATWKAQRSQRLDQAALAREHPHLFEQYKRVSETRVFRLK